MRTIVAIAMATLALPAGAETLRSPWLEGTGPNYLQQPPTEKANLTDKDELKIVTVGIMAGVAAILIAWDIYVAKKDSQTESQVLSHTGWNYSSLPFTFGVLAGHWFFNTDKPDYRLVPIGIAILVAVIVWDLVRPDQGEKWARYPGVWFSIGVVTGATTWPQRGKM